MLTVCRLVAQFAVRIYREASGGYLGTIDGLGTVRGKSLGETVRAARSLLGQVLAGAFPDRPGVEPAGADLVVWFEVVLTRRRASKQD